VETGDPSAFSVNLFGIPEIPEALPRAISLTRLHNIVFISSCKLVHGPPSSPRVVLRNAGARDAMVRLVGSFRFG
jgi:hypothetical protein